MDGRVVLVGQVDEDLEGVHKKAVCFAPVLLADGCDDVTTVHGKKCFCRLTGGSWGCGRLQQQEE